MKTFDAPLEAHYATRETTLAYGMKVTRTDGVILAVTSHDINDPIDGITYLANPGLNITDIVIAVGNLDLKTLHDQSVFTTVDIFNGVWTNAAFIIFRYNWASISDGIDALLTGTLGELEVKQTEVVSELRDIRQYMQQDLSVLSSKTCRARLGDSKCRVVLGGSPPAFTYTGTITSVTSNQVFRDSSRTEIATWFDEGEFFFNTGINAGVRMKVKSYEANGTFTLALPLFGTVAIGNTYTAIAGCRKRLEEDCLAKFNNVLNFQGEPHRRGINNLTSAPDVSV